VRNFKTLIKPIGYLITALSVGYLCTIIAGLDWQVLKFESPLKSFFWIFLFGVWASLFVLVGAYNWKLILDFLGGTSLPLKDVFSVYLRSNVAKYLPGNVMHLAGRNFLGSRLGWNNSEIAFSSLLEMVLGLGLTGLIIAAFVAAGMVNLPPQVPLRLDCDRIAWYAAIAAAGLLFSVLFIYAYRLLVHRETPAETSVKLYGRGKQFVSTRFLLLLGKMALLSLACFVLNCAFYFYLCDLVLGFRLNAADFFNANTALAIAGYFGVLTPGAPGGLGVRESVSMLLLSAYGYPKEALVLSLIVFRVVCTLGDLFPYLVVKACGGRRIEGTDSSS